MLRGSIYPLHAAEPSPAPTLQAAWLGNGGFLELLIKQVLVLLFNGESAC